MKKHRDVKEGEKARTTTVHGCEEDRVDMGKKQSHKSKRS